MSSDILVFKTPNARRMRVSSEDDDAAELEETLAPRNKIPKIEENSKVPEKEDVAAAKPVRLPKALEFKPLKRKKKRFTTHDMPMPVESNARVLVIETTIMHSNDTCTPHKYYDIPIAFLNFSDWRRLVTMHGVFNSIDNDAENDYKQSDWELIKQAAGIGAEELFSDWLARRFPKCRVQLEKRRPICHFAELIETGIIEI